MFRFGVHAKWTFSHRPAEVEVQLFVDTMSSQHLKLMLFCRSRGCKRRTSCGVPALVSTSYFPRRDSLRTATICKLPTPWISHEVGGTSLHVHVNHHSIVPMTCCRNLAVSYVYGPV